MLSWYSPDLIVAKLAERPRPFRFEVSSITAYIYYHVHVHVQWHECMHMYMCNIQCHVYSTNVRDMVSHTHTG